MVRVDNRVNESENIRVKNSTLSRRFYTRTYRKIFNDESIMRREIIPSGEGARAIGQASDELPLREASDETRVPAVIIARARMTKISRRSASPARIERLLRMLQECSSPVASIEHL